jgi:hypothetical protein
MLLYDIVIGIGKQEKSLIRVCFTMVTPAVIWESVSVAVS